MDDNNQSNTEEVTSSNPIIPELSIPENSTEETKAEVTEIALQQPESTTEKSIDTKKYELPEDVGLANATLREWLNQAKKDGDYTAIIHNLENRNITVIPKPAYIYIMNKNMQQAAEIRNMLSLVDTALQSIKPLVSNADKIMLYVGPDYADTKYVNLAALGTELQRLIRGKESKLIATLKKSIDLSVFEDLSEEQFVEIYDTLNRHNIDTSSITEIKEFFEEMGFIANKSNS